MADHMEETQISTYYLTSTSTTTTTRDESRNLIEEVKGVRVRHIKCGLERKKCSKEDAYHQHQAIITRVPLPKEESLHSCRSKFPLKISLVVGGLPQLGVKMNLNSLSIYAVNGALRCLALLSADLDDTVVPKIVPHSAMKDYFYYDEGERSIKAIVDAAKRRISESQQEKATGSSSCWRMVHLPLARFFTSQWGVGLVALSFGVWMSHPTGCVFDLSSVASS
ncbi:hypothetical protein LguiB_012440 [Lonicera macranthoides]